jgi:hypothetical protein
MNCVSSSTKKENHCCLFSVYRIPPQYEFPNGMNALKKKVLRKLVCSYGREIQLWKIPGSNSCAPEKIESARFIGGHCRLMQPYFHDIVWVSSYKPTEISELTLTIKKALRKRDIGADFKEILKWVLLKLGVRMWAGYIHIRRNRLLGYEPLSFSANLPSFLRNVLFPLSWWTLILNIQIIFILVALRPSAGHGLLIFEVSRSQTTTHHSR